MMKPTGLYLFRHPREEDSPEMRDSENAVKAIVDGVLRSYRVDPIILGDEKTSSGQITDTFIRVVSSTSVVIANLSGLSPVVSWEIGYAIAIGRSVIQIASSVDQEAIQARPYIGSASIIWYSDAELQSLSSKLHSSVSNLPISASTNISTKLSADIAGLPRHLLSLKCGTDLFGKCQTHELTQLMRRVNQWSDDVLVVLGSQQVRMVGAAFHPELRSGGFAVLYYPGLSSWLADRDKETDDDYDESLFKAIRRNNLDVTRVYVLTRPEQADEEPFRQRVLRDAAHGLNVEYVCLTNDEIDKNPGICDFALWDNELYAKVEYDQGAIDSPVITRCVYARKPPDSTNDHSGIIGEIEKNRRRIEDHSTKRAAPRLHSETHYLKQSWSLYRDLAREACSESGFGCGYIHENWQILKLAGMVANPRWHKKFYDDTIADLVERHSGESLDVLIVGPADYGLLYRVLEATSLNPEIEIRFVVADRCTSSLRICEWFNRNCYSPEEPLSLNFRVDQYHGSAYPGIEFADNSFDLICADGFLSDAIGNHKINRSKFVSTIIDDWWRLLRPGGRICTTARIKSVTTETLTLSKDKFVQRAQDLVESEADRLSRLGILDHLVDSARAYSESATVSPFTSIEEVRSLIDKFIGKTDKESLRATQRYDHTEMELFRRTEWAYINIVKNI